MPSTLSTANTSSSAPAVVVTMSVAGFTRVRATRVVRFHAKRYAKSLSAMRRLFPCRHHLCGRQWLLVGLLLVVAVLTLWWYPSQSPHLSPAVEETEEDVLTDPAVLKPLAHLPSLSRFPLLPPVYTDDRVIMQSLPPLRAIPRILHFAWRTSSLPTDGLRTVQLWRLRYPAWRVVLWTDARIAWLADLAVQRSPMWRLFAGYPSGAMRADFARYLVLHLIGGVFLDIDVRPQDGMEALLDHHSCVVARQAGPDVLTRPGERHLLASSAFLASAPDHPFWALLLQLLAEPQRQRSAHIDARTGAVALTEALTAYESVHRLVVREAAVFLAPALYFDPPPAAGPLRTAPELILRLRADVCAALEWPRPLPRSGLGAYRRRMCSALWWWLSGGEVNWTALWRQPRHFRNGSFARHLRFGTAAEGGANPRVRDGPFSPVASLGFALTLPEQLLAYVPVKSAYEYDEVVLSSGPDMALVD